MAYESKPTDATLAVPGGANEQFKPQPANPVFFSSTDEVAELVADLQRTETIPVGVPFEILDMPYTVGPVVYGKDGRKVYIVKWSENYAGQTVDFMPNAQLLYVALKNDPTGRWVKLYDSGNIVRQGQSVGGV